MTKRHNQKVHTQPNGEHTLLGGQQQQDQQDQQ